MPIDVHGHPEHVHAWKEAERQHARRETAWHAILRAQGIALVHPDDGWVNRARHTVSFAYPTILNGPPAVGALVALGDSRAWRVVRLLSFRPWAVRLDPSHGDWSFEEVSSV